MAHDDDIRRAAKVLSTLGSSKGGKARFAKLTREERRVIAQKAARARWARYRARHTELTPEPVG